MKMNKGLSSELDLANKRLFASLRLTAFCLIILISAAWIWGWNIFSWIISIFTLLEIKSLINEWLTVKKMNNEKRISNDTIQGSERHNSSNEQKYFSTGDNHTFEKVLRDEDVFYEIKVKTTRERQFVIRTLDNAKIVQAIRPVIEKILENTDQFYDRCIEVVNVQKINFQAYSDELNAVEITAVEFFSQDTPIVAEIIYSTNNPDRVWTSLWDGENFYDLSFDGHA